MNLSDYEKLSLAILCEIHTALKLSDNGLDSKFITKALDTGNEWAISSRFGDYLGFEKSKHPEKVNFIYNVLDMWSFIEEGVEALTEEERVTLKERAAPFGKNPRFNGFDGNNETSYLRIASFIVNDTDAFGGRFADRDLNSHVPRVEKYKRMYAVFEPWRDNYPGRPLNVDELVELLTV
ncbi:YfbU family protein [Cronobacter dublinensis]|uniref:YfbU family protein n=1 Tax=Cronobacter dublinensis TaxID=413497 RepID=UPI0024AEA050|nr:YfbU family protein [Cronobacter dublinensis]MDI7501749.1 YfbU family protein [Cronobacter dublinensis]